MMRVFVLGGTGKTGKEVVRLALERGWEVTAAVRDLTNLQDMAQGEGGDRLKMEKANISVSSSMVPLMQGCDCVISCLGASGLYPLLPWATVQFYSESMKHIVAAMKEAEVKRLLVMTSWCTVYKSEHPFVIEWLLKPLMLGRHLADMGRMEDFLAKESPDDIKFTSVKPPGLNEKPATGKTIAVEGQFHPDGGYEMPRADVAAWMLDNIDQEQWNGSHAAIGIPK